MIDRIKKLMGLKKLSATQFSDEIEIQRSSLSHVLSGRNKPSLDFMLKIKSTYPEIELDWLLLGKGEMIKKPEKHNIVSQISIPEMNREVEIDLNQAEKTIEIPAVKETESVEKHSLNERISNKQPSRVLLFYHDNTFESYESMH